MIAIFLRETHFKPLLLLLVGFLVIALAVVQDAIQYYFFDQNAFNLGESLLFESFWFLFIPLSAIVFHISGAIRAKSSGRKAMLISLAGTLLTSAFHFLLHAALVFSVSKVSGGHVFGFVDVLQHSLAEDMFICLIVYLTAWSSIFWLRFPNERKQLPEADTLTPHSNSWLERISITIGASNIVIDTDDIFYITAASPYSCIHTGRGKFLHPDTLRSLEEKLDPKLFLRVHKSSIVNVRQVASYKSRQNGDYDLSLRNGELLRLSRNYKHHFRSHFN